MSNAIRADFDQVIEHLRQAIRPLKATTIATPLLEAEGCILAQDISTQFDFPLFDNSAMDGFAIRSSDFESDDPTILTLPICGIATAGHPFENEVPRGAALRIMTGAPLPADLDAVIPIEQTEVIDQSVRFAPGQLKAGSNVRRQGEIFHKGECLLKAPRRLTRGDLGLAASLGYATLPCYPRLRVAVFSSGDELIEPNDGLPLTDGKIYNANGTFVTLAARSVGTQATYLGILPDDATVIEAHFKEAAQQYDLVICSGGVGPGDCDFTASVLNRIANLQHYHVAMRPGKPFSFGTFKEGRALILGLPGNPVASATSAEFFLRFAIAMLEGVPYEELTLTAKLHGKIKTRERRRDFIRGQLQVDPADGLIFIPANQQSSASLLSVSRSNAIAEIPERATGTMTEGLITVHLR